MERGYFIDGPDHGTTRTFESEPPARWRSAAELTMQVDPSPAVDRATSHVYVYERTYRTRKGTWIFEYAGLES